ncbi:M15 family metallopeptidase [Thalassomonas viridans]|uniref:D-alanyl-D-alanine dipeptidase n=1 Tax=Thalassomonas viridans TaxID=137584 RepID=A0AAE9YY19_9GAMM|nr:M15 family metallopeptidase [Thalassomonas viridans]WDE03115.1 M15 family metallopeptidase [Thalassomonas viridans]
MAGKNRYLAVWLNLILICGAFVCRPVFAAGDKSDIPEGFVVLTEVIPTIEIELRYYSDDNFVGRRIPGYEKPEALLTEQAAKALAGAQAELMKFGLGLKVYDAYRPQRAVDFFARWAKDLKDTKMKARYYPEVAKKDLFDHGYIAAKSGHSRGSTLDVTLVSLVGVKPVELDMGTTWDYFSVSSWPANLALTPQQRANRMLLQQVMLRQGFSFLEEEWWHFTLKDEPFNDQYFNFAIK